MKEISVFDVIGPNMIGPSSSHTAGALRIALFVKKLLHAPVKHVEFVLYGSFAQTYKGHGTDKALVAGILGMGTEDEGIRTAFEQADEAAITYTFTIGEDNPDYHPNTVEVIVTDQRGEITKVRGASIGGGNIRIHEIQGIEVEFTGEYVTIIIKQQDTPGVIAHMTTCLSHYHINIAYMKLYRESKGSLAYTIIETDEMVDHKVVEEMREHPSILDVNIIQGV
ncbi:MAG: L-serine ammonia-lyase, iron-sulfur-dependent subunit beta [Cellulosilyticaceae bacterium]